MQRMHEVAHRQVRSSEHAEQIAHSTDTTQEDLERYVRDARQTTVPTGQCAGTVHVTVVLVERAGVTVRDTVLYVELDGHVFLSGEDLELGGLAGDEVWQLLHGVFEGGERVADLGTEVNYQGEVIASVLTERDAAEAGHVLLEQLGEAVPVLVRERTVLSDNSCRVFDDA